MQKLRPVNAMISALMTLCLVHGLINLHAFQNRVPPGVTLWSVLCGLIALTTVFAGLWAIRKFGRIMSTKYDSRVESTFGELLTGAFSGFTLIAVALIAVMPGWYVNARYDSPVVYMFGALSLAFVLSLIHI